MENNNLVIRDPITETETIVPAAVRMQIEDFSHALRVIVNSQATGQGYSTSMGKLKDTPLGEEWVLAGIETARIVLARTGLSFLYSSSNIASLREGDSKARSAGGR